MNEKNNIQNRDFIRVSKSKIHGQGVFAKRNIPKGTRIIEYIGDRVPLTTLLIESNEGKQANFYAFGLDSSTFIDGTKNGNDARFINHSCQPNCESYIFDQRVFIYAARDIRRFEELTFDYQLGNPFKKIKSKKFDDLYKCNCGAPNCSGTMISHKKNKNY